MGKQFDPYREWLGVEEAQRPLTYYQLLRLNAAQPTPEAIEQAVARQIAGMQEHLKGPRAQLARRTLYELESAKQCLLDPAKRRRYDEALCSGVHASATPAATSTPRSNQQQPQSRSALDDLLDEALPRPAEPDPPPNPNIAALCIPAALEKRFKLPAWLPATLVPITILVPVLGLLGLAWLVFSRFDRPSVGAKTAVQSPPADGVASNSVASAPQPVYPRIERSPDSNPVNPFQQPPASSGGFGSGGFSNGGFGTGPTNGPQGPIFSPIAPAIDATPVRRVAVPAADALAQAKQRLNDLLAKELAAANTTASKAALAERLIDQAGQMRDDPAVRYALLDLALSLGIESGDAGLVVEAIDQLDAYFTLDALTLKFTALSQMFARVLPGDQQRALLFASMLAADQAAEAERYEEALKLTQLGFDAARQLGAAPLVKLLAAKGSQLTAAQQRYAAAQQALVRLKQQPNDPIANQQLGEWYWYDKHDPDKAFGYLAKAGNHDLQAAVVQDLSVPQDAAAQYALAGAWWDLSAQKDEGATRTEFRRRALHWYVKSRSQLSGIPLATTRRRIATLDLEFGSHYQQPLLVDLDHETTKLELSDQEVPQTATLSLEILGLSGMPADAPPLSGNRVSGHQVLAIVLRGPEPRVEVHLKLATVADRRVLLISPVIVDTNQTTVPFINDRVNNLATRVPAQLDDARQRLASVLAQGSSLEYDLEKLSRLSVVNVVAAQQRDFQIKLGQKQLSDLAKQRDSLAHIIAMLERRVELTPPLVKLQQAVHNKLRISLRVFTQVNGSEVELLRTD